MFESKQSRRRACVLAAAACCAAGMLGAASTAQAALGGSPMATPQGASVTTSAASATTGTATMRNEVTSGASAAMSGSSGTSGAAGAANYTVRSTTLGTGTVVREYVSASGQVFGVFWDGRFMPKLSDIFGPQYYQQYVDGASAAQAAHGVARGPSTVEQDGLVVHSGGHMGHFVGNAYVPALLPPGVTSDDIR
jgi:hypothetical protein